MPDQKIFERESRGPRASYERGVSWSCSVVISKDHARGEFLKKSLIEGILEKGPQEVLFVKRIFDAARWDISIEDVEEHYAIEYKRQTVMNICITLTP
jgi:hypothetical protein